MKNHPFQSSDGVWEIQLGGLGIYGFPVRVEWRSNGQATPTLGAAGADYRASPTGSHTNEKAMGAFAANYRRLISTFHDKTLKSSRMEPWIR
jgi:hypothetical protein